MSKLTTFLKFNTNFLNIFLISLVLMLVASNFSRADDATNDAAMKAFNEVSHTDHQEVMTKEFGGADYLSNANSPANIHMQEVATAKVQFEAHLSAIRTDMESLSKHLSGPERTTMEQDLETFRQAEETFAKGVGELFLKQSSAGLDEAKQLLSAVEVINTNIAAEFETKKQAIIQQTSLAIQGHVANATRPYVNHHQEMLTKFASHNPAFSFSSGTTLSALKASARISE